MIVPRVLLATTNLAKSERLASICEGLSLEVINGAEIANVSGVDELGASHMGIAVQKAIVWSQRYPLVALASDGGLVIPALGNNWDSTLTRRLGEDAITDEERARRLVSRMRDLPRVDRMAYWAESIAIARNGILICAWETEGLCGVIGEDYRPDPETPAGFWADALWETTDGRKRWELLDEEQSPGADPWLQLRGPVRELLAKLC